MDIRELRYFLHVAELKSFTKASMQLRVAQPALSRQIQKLEQELGTPLLIRSGKGLELTEAGALLLRRAYSILRQVAQTREDVRAQGSMVSGTITLGVPPAAGELIVPPVIDAAARLYPQVRINVIEGFSGFLYERLLKQEINLALLHNPMPHKELDVHPLLIEEMYLIGPASPHNDILPAGEIGSLRELPLILPGRPHSLRLLIERALADQGIPLNLRLEVDGLNLIRALVSHGHGYTVLTYGSVYNQVQAGTLSAHHLTDPKITWSLALASLADQRKSRIVEAVVRIIRAQTHKLVDSGIWRGDPHYSPEEKAAAAPADEEAELG